MPKNIVLFSDGTGNSANKLFKTNVWRLYQALDLNPDPGKPTQLPYHDDGVGTSSLGFLAALGGAFGYGLKRNVLDLYCFLSRHYQEGDQIYAFGFSRGAFTIRVLVGLIANQGIVQAKTEIERRNLANQAYWAYLERRHCQSGERGPLTPFCLKVRKWLGLTGQSTLPVIRLNEERKIRFVGLWDTVSAYGGNRYTVWLIDKFYPVRFADHRLTPYVERACHALALDDERRSFHPEIWDEKGEEDPERISQIWFAGMHSNVGGSYPDDGMSLTSLLWMIDEAETAGLHFSAAEVARARAAANPHGKMYNSRRGLGRIYIYTPRQLPTEGGGPKIHSSVFQRIEQQSEGYAPIVLPPRFTIVPAHRPPNDPQHLRSIAEELPGKVDSLVSTRIWAQRLGLFSAVALVLMPFFSRLDRWLAAKGWKGLEVLAPLHEVNDHLYRFFASFERFNEWVSTVWELMGKYLLPALLVRYVGYFLDRPLFVLPLMFCLVLAIWWGNRTERAIHARAQEAWSRKPS